MIASFWLPYYFTQIGFGSTSTILGLTIPFGCLIGSTALVPLVNRCDHFSSKATIIIIALCLLFTVSALLTGSDRGSVPIYFMEFLIINALNVVP